MGCSEGSARPYSSFGVRAALSSSSDRNRGANVVVESSGMPTETSPSLAGSRVADGTCSVTLASSCGARLSACSTEEHATVRW